MLPVHIFRNINEKRDFLDVVILSFKGPQWPAITVLKL